MSITLFCLVQGTPAFPVDIDKNRTVGHLKDAIKAKKAPEFDSWPPDKLRLWKVEIPVKRDDLIQGQTLQDDNQLPPTDYLYEYWTDTPKRRHIHVIIKLPFLQPRRGAVTTTSTGGDSPIEVVLWDRFFDDVNNYPFDKKEPKFDRPQFKNDYANVRIEEDVREAFSVNICQRLMEDPFHNFKHGGCDEYSMYTVYNKRRGGMDLPRVAVNPEPGNLPDGLWDWSLLPWSEETQPTGTALTPTNTYPRYHREPRVSNTESSSDEDVRDLS
ncbi:3498_t:CDS:2, partial [Paraglomus occultum]